MMLVAAVVAATGTGVAVAYGLCVAVFGCFRLHAEWTTERSTRLQVTDPRALEASS